MGHLGRNGQVGPSGLWDSMTINTRGIWSSSLQTILISLPIPRRGNLLPQPPALPRWGQTQTRWTTPSYSAWIVYNSIAQTVDSSVSDHPLNSFLSPSDLPMITLTYFQSDPAHYKLVSFPFHTNPIFPSPINLSHWVPMLSPTLPTSTHPSLIWFHSSFLIRFLPLQPFVSFTYHLPASVAISTLPSTPLTPSVNQSLLTWIHLAFANSCHLPRYTGLAPLYHQSRWKVWAEPTVHFPPQMLPDPLSSSNSLFFCSRFHHLQSLVSTETTILESYYIWM